MGEDEIRIPDLMFTMGMFLLIVQVAPIVVNQQKGRCLPKAYWMNDKMCDYEGNAATHELELAHLHLLTKQPQNTSGSRIILWSTTRTLPRVRVSTGVHLYLSFCQRMACDKHEDCSLRGGLTVGSNMDIIYHTSKSWVNYHLSK